MIQLIEKLTLKYKTNEIETALVQLFIEINKIEFHNNELINSIISDQGLNISSLKLEIQKHLKKLDLYDLINIFELLIPKNDKKINGAFFTPKNITKFIVENTVKSNSDTICDPSCGCGAFLIEAADYIHNTFKIKIVDIIERNLYGIDIANYSIFRSKILLTLLALQNNEDQKTINFNIYTANSLTDDWNKYFPDILKQGGFDVVIGNPPYVKFQDLNIEMRGNLNKDWQTLKNGTYNLYFAFFELGIRILNTNGILAFITPNNYFTSLAAIDLRKYFNSNTLLYKIVDFNHLKIFNAQTYTCITFLKKGKKNNFFYERIDEYKNLNNLKKIKYSTIKYSNLNNKKWRLLRDSDQNNIKKIETVGNKLGDIVDIRVGVATCKDSVYFIDGTTYSNGYYKKEIHGKTYLIESKITKPIAKISDFKTQTQLDDNKRRIIFPYTKNNGEVKIISENDLIEKYPECYKYLVAAKSELTSRDKGRLEYPQWYSYARTQGLNFIGEKLFTPTFSLEPRFLMEKDNESMFCNGYAIFLKQKNTLFGNNLKINLAIIAKILNSKIMDYYIKRTSVSIEGGYPCYQKNFIELFGIPSFTDQELVYLTKEDNKDEINNFLINKYQIQI